MGRSTVHATAASSTSTARWPTVRPRSRWRWKPLLSKGIRSSWADATSHPTCIGCEEFNNISQWTHVRRLVGPRAHTADMLDLILPLECGGCGAPSTRWCAACARQLALKADEPHLISPRVDPGVPVLSLGRCAGARREAIVAVKEHGRADLIAPLATALQAGIERLLNWGVLDTPLTVVPAPTRRSAAR